MKPKLETVEGNPSTTEPAVTPPDPFDLDSLSVPQDFASQTAVKKLLKTIPVRRPGPQTFFRVHPDPGYRRNFTCIELKDEREVFLVRPEVAPELVGETVMKTFFTAMSRQGVLFLLPVSLPGPGQKDMEWWRSLREACEIAMHAWIRVRPNMHLGGYEPYQAVSEDIPDPVWPDLTFQEILRIARRDHMIAASDHEVIAQLRGA